MTHSAEYRYTNDAAFKLLVDTLYHQIVTHQYTPTELRDAAMLAAIHYEYTHIRPSFIFPEIPR
jgi:hypothetical protein